MSLFSEAFAQEHNQLSKERILDSGEIFRGAREVIIQHDNSRYRLLITKAGKLILNK